MTSIERLHALITAKTGERDSIADELAAVQGRLEVAKRELKQLRSDLAFELHGVRFGDMILVTEEILAEFRRRGDIAYHVSEWRNAGIVAIEGIMKDDTLYIAINTLSTGIQPDLVKAARAAYLERYA